MPSNRATVATMRKRGKLRAGVNGDPARQWAWLMGGDYPQSPYPAGETEAMALPPFGRGVALLANALADTDWFVARWDSDVGVHQRIPNQPAVVRQPNPDSTVWNYRWAAAEDGILYGNHWALIGEQDPANGYWPKNIWPLPAEEVWAMIDPETGRAWWVYQGQTVAPGDIFHVSFGNRSGEILGRGILRQYCDWLGGAVAAEDHAGAYFAGGAMPPAVLQSPQVLGQDQADQLKAAWRSVANTREPVVLPMGYVLTPLVSNAEQNQLVQSRTWNAQSVAMMLGIPPYKLGLPGTTMTYQNVETADIDFIRDSVTRYASPLAEAFTQFLLPGPQVLKFDYTSRMRADQSTTANVLTKYTSAGILTLDEARSMLGRPPLEITVEPGTTPAEVPELTPAEVT